MQKFADRWFPSQHKHEDHGDKKQHIYTSTEQIDNYRTSVDDQPDYDKHSTLRTIAEDETVLPKQPTELRRSDEMVEIPNPQRQDHDAVASKKEHIAHEVLQRFILEDLQMVLQCELPVPTLNPKEAHVPDHVLKPARRSHEIAEVAKPAAPATRSHLNNSQFSYGDMSSPLGPCTDDVSTLAMEKWPKDIPHKAITLDKRGDVACEVGSAMC